MKRKKVGFPPPEGFNLAVQINTHPEPEHWHNRPMLRVHATLIGVVDPAARPAPDHRHHSLYGTPLYGLTAVAYAEARDHDDVWGWGDVQFRETHSIIDRNTAEGMLRAFKHADRALAAMNEEEGRPESFGHFVGRFARAFGAQLIVTDVPAKTAETTGERYRIERLGDGISSVNHLLRTWIAAQLQKTAAA